MSLAVLEVCMFIKPYSQEMPPVETINIMACLPLLTMSLTHLSLIFLALSYYYSLPPLLSHIFNVISSLSLFSFLPVYGQIYPSIYVSQYKQTLEVIESQCWHVPAAGIPLALLLVGITG